MKEDIKVLEELKEEYITSGLYQIGTFELSEREKEAIENLINRNKELESELQYKNDQLFLEDTQWERYIDRNYIPKSKVREKIEELEIIKKEHSKSFNWSDWEDEDVYTEIIAWFKELLQEGDK